MNNYKFIIEKVNDHKFNSDDLYCVEVNGQSVCIKLAEQWFESMEFKSLNELNKIADASIDFKEMLEQGKEFAKSLGFEIK